jgi:thioester reductase-like protein
VSEPDSIFLTGATGFLGAFLLHELLEQTRADIYCLIRSPNADEGTKRLQSKLESYSLWNETFRSRIIPVVGELSEPLLGLSEQQFRHLASQIDVIYHNGASVNFIYPYSQLKAANVLGTQEVLRLASLIKAKHVHFISTLSVFSSPAYSEVKVVKESDPLDYSVLAGGYAQSKWVAEKLVMKARDRGLTVSIYRPGTITGHSQTGVCNTDDLLCRTIKGCIQLGRVVDLDMMLDMMVEMIPVDYVSRAIVHLSRQKESRAKAFHLVNPHPMPVSDLVNWFRSVGYALEQVSYDKWRAELIDHAERSSENALHPLLPLFSEEIPSQEETELQEPQFDCQNTLDGLAGTDIVCPPVDTELLGTYFSYFMSCGFLDAPQLTSALNP